MAYAEIDVNESNVMKRVAVQSAWNEKPLLEMVPGAHWDDKSRVWRAPLTWAAAVTLRGVFGPAFTYGPLLTQWLIDEKTRRIDPVMFIRDRVDWPTEWPTPRPGTFASADILPFQAVGAMFMIAAESGVLGDDMGTGKTVQSLSMLYALREQGLPALVVCPNGVKRHWARLAEKWCPTATPYVVAGTAAQRNKLIAQAKLDPTALVIINIESARLFSRLAPYGSVRLARCTQCDKSHGDPTLSPSRCEVHPKALNNFGFKVGFVDEAHNLQNAQAKQTRAIWSIMHDPSLLYCWGLSGTIIGNHIGDLWSVMHAVAPREYPVKGKWVDRYALMSWTSGGGTEVVGLRPDTRVELFKFFDPRFRRMSQAQVLPQLPPKERFPRYVELPASHRKMYDDIDKRLFTRTPSGELLITPDNLVAQTRLLQLASAPVDVEKPDVDDVSTWKVKLKENSPKLDEMMKILDELGDRPVAIAAEHRQLIDLASARLVKAGIKHGFLTGGQSEFERDQQLQLFRSGHIRVLLFTIKAGSEGHDMSIAGTLIVLQRSWRMINDLQMERRVYRFDSTRHARVQIIDIVAEGTVEERQLVRLYERYERLEEINRDRQQLIAAGQDTTALDREANAIVNSWLGNDVIADGEYVTTPSTDHED